MTDDPSLDAIRAQLRRMEEPIVRALIERARFRRNAAALGRLDPAGMDTLLARAYAAEIVPYLCGPGDDGRGQESAAVDQRLLSLLAERIRLGIRVADAKASREPARFGRLAAAADRSALLAALTNAEVEREVVSRVRALAESEGAPPEPSAVAEVFARWIIPLTKETEADRLLAARLD